MAFRGTRNIKNWVFTNANIDMEKYGCKGCKVHEGFRNLYLGMKEQIILYVRSLKAFYSDALIVVTGHSLGGAMATLAAYDLRKLFMPIELINFGSPRVGNKEFAAAFNTLFRPSP